MVVLGEEKLETQNMEKNIGLDAKNGFSEVEFDFSNGFSRPCPIALQGGVFDKKAFQTLHSPLKAPR